MLEEIQHHCKDLDLEKYKVVLIWDPVSCMDVGWITLLRGVHNDNISSFQFRDVNLNSLKDIGYRALETETFGRSSQRKQDQTNLMDEIISDSNFVEAIAISPMNCKAGNKKIVVKTDCNTANKKLSRASQFQKFSCNCGKAFSSEKGLNVHIGRNICHNPEPANNTAVVKNKVSEIRKLGQYKYEEHKAQKIVIKVPKLQKKLIAPMLEKIKFKIYYKALAYQCSRLKGKRVGSCLRKFAQLVNNDNIFFEFKGKKVSGLEEVDEFNNGIIFAKEVKKELE